MTELIKAPLDQISSTTLASKGLELALVDTSHPAEFEAWLRADVRGFHGSEPSSETIALSIAGLADRRTTGVWDSSVPHASLPVATVSSWPLELSVPGRRKIDAWAISSVTVSPTHRRKGIARALLEAELRTAHTAGVPMATLTVSESTIYGRFGFAPAAFATDLTIDTTRARWIGPDVPGRVHFITREQFRMDVATMHERMRLDSPGQIVGWDRLWDRLAGLTDDDPSKNANLRAVRYDDQHGKVRGLALYRVVGDSSDDAIDFARHTLTVEYLSHETDDAYSALWRYLIEMDLVGTVRAGLRSVDEPLSWNLSDRRAATLSTWDHLWLRILNVKETLEARSFSCEGRCVLRVQDDLGYAAGTFLLDVDGAGVGRVTAHSDSDDADVISLPVSALSALYLGGVSATTLAAAGIIVGAEESVARLDALFHSSRAPWLSVWF
ncbi:MAG: GNAT family N-acetyltransferase [Rhodoglobus sp.]|uniref:GNAT family N-acetyltransferase n=1 Tax=Salinibacterium sp. G-O1 TaxID=3046208 RepID=UPI0024B89F0F|nr:GNAT family N-acetyltransferase [Salinibacterium sp. G-O1]MDJ0335075.1 GNAT family N-acetyltransferase [Salinibacterium sp. G-O1]